MIVLHELDGNFAELTDREAFLARVEAADKLAWAGETGQLGLEHRGPGGTSWLFLSLVADGRYLVYSQRPSGERIYAVDPAGDPATLHDYILAGRNARFADDDLIPASEAVDAARYFIAHDGLLTPVVHWRRNGEPHWPEF